MRGVRWRLGYQIFRKRREIMAMIKAIEYEQRNGRVPEHVP